MTHDFKSAGGRASTESAAQTDSPEALALLDLANDLFDTQATLECLSARLEMMAGSDEIDDHAAGMLMRVLRVSCARIQAAAEDLNDRHCRIVLGEGA